MSSKCNFRMKNGQLCQRAVSVPGIPCFQHINQKSQFNAQKNEKINVPPTSLGRKGGLIDSWVKYNEVFPDLPEIINEHSLYSQSRASISSGIQSMFLTNLEKIDSSDPKTRDEAIRNIYREYVDNIDSVIAKNKYGIPIEKAKKYAHSVKNVWGQSSYASALTAVFAIEAAQKIAFCTDKKIDPQGLEYSDPLYKQKIINLVKQEVYNIVKKEALNIEEYTQIKFERKPLINHKLPEDLVLDNHQEHPRHFFDASESATRIIESTHENKKKASELPTSAKAGLLAIEGAAALAQAIIKYNSSAEKDKRQEEAAKRIRIRRTLEAEGKRLQRGE